MAKKYLLYIHVHEFEVEENKSALANELLARHYSALDNANHEVKNYGRPGQPIGADDRVIPDIKSNLLVTNSIRLPERNFEFCEHSAGIGMCKVKKCSFYQFNPRNRSLLEASVALDANAEGGINTKRVGKQEKSWK